MSTTDSTTQSGPRSRQGSNTESRARITERDALYLAFLSKFPAADAEALSFLATRAPNPFGAQAGELTDPNGVAKRMTKLARMGAVTRYRSPLSSVIHYGVTALGHEGALFHGYDVPTFRTTEGISVSRLEHYRNVALVAGQLASPATPLRHIGVSTPIPLAQLISENEMRAAYTPAAHGLRKLREAGDHRATYAALRQSVSTERTARAEAGELAWGDILATAPELWTVASDGDPEDVKTIHQPDISARRDDDHRDAGHKTPKNWLIEVEISAKTPADYARTIRTLADELTAAIAYERAIYFCGTPAIRKQLENADRATGASLIQRRRLILANIEGRTPHPARLSARVTVPNTPPPTVPAAPATAPQKRPQSTRAPQAPTGLPRPTDRPTAHRNGTGA